VKNLNKLRGEDMNRGTAKIIAIAIAVVMVISAFGGLVSIFG